MSSPYEHRPFPPTDSPQGQQPLSGQPPLNPPPYWPPLPAPKQSNGLAIAGVVLGSLALLIGLGTFVVPLLFAAIMLGGAASQGGFPPLQDLQGTAPQVVQGRAYPGALLEHEVERVIRFDGGTVRSVSCPATFAVVARTVTLCHGVVDDMDSELEVTFEDDMGHFTIVQN